jgi:hypothetical protein
MVVRRAERVAALLRCAPISVIASADRLPAGVAA